MKYFKLPFESDEEGSFIFDKGGQMVAQIRGWGWLKYKGENEALNEQQAAQEFIVDACNSIEELKAELKDLKAEVTLFRLFAKIVFSRIFPNHKELGGIWSNRKWSGNELEIMDTVKEKIGHEN